MQCAIHVLPKVDPTVQKVQVGKSIITKLAEGNIHEAFHHLKGWYWSAMETHWSAMETRARPCSQTMEKHTIERFDLYRQYDSLGPPIIIYANPVEVGDDRPTNGEIRVAVSKLTYGRKAGASHMQAELLKEWLQGIKLAHKLRSSRQIIFM